MALNLTQKILSSHLVDGNLTSGSEIGIKIDQTLTQDATGTMAFLQFEALGLDKVKTEKSVSYVDHNMLQTSFENADDHRYLQSVASKYGVYYSRPGNGICHQVHLERFSAPGKTLLGCDSHTPTCGGAGMLAIGAGGLDVAVAMGGGAFYTKMPKILGVKLTGKLRSWVSSKDIILYLLGKLTVKGGVGRILEYFGDGVSTLTVPERATVTNMGAELGATTSIFPSDTQTLAFLASQGRAAQYTPLAADENATYDELIEVNLSELEPMIALPGSPDNVIEVSKVEGREVDQVLIGSCTNSSYKDLATVAFILKGKTVNSRVSLAITPGSRQAMQESAKSGFLETFITSGARILESACGPCIGMGQAPSTGAVSLRTFNRNFTGRSGTQNDAVYLVSPAIAAASALTGMITNPMTLGTEPQFQLPVQFTLDDSMIVKPSDEPSQVEVIRGPNIAPLPQFPAMENDIESTILIKLEDNISTDHILPAGAKVLPLRSNVPKISEFVFTNVDKEFVQRAKQASSGVIIGGENYGQGSSREHAALAPRYLGVRAVIVKSFARIHKANLVNFGILPLVFINKDDYNAFKQGDKIELLNVQAALDSESKEFKAKVNGVEYTLKAEISKRDAEILKAGGLLNYTREQSSKPKGEKIQMTPNGLLVPNNPIVPFIEGDGIGTDITPVMINVVNSAVKKAYNGEKNITWVKVPAGESAMPTHGSLLPQETLDAIKDCLVAIKGPLTTPIGTGFRSVNVALRQELDLYACVRPVKWYPGVPSPVKRPQDVNMTIFRENTEDVYAGIEFTSGSSEAKKIIEAINSVSKKKVNELAAIGIKPVTEKGSKRLIKAAIKHALSKKSSSVTLVHKGNIMKFTEGAFNTWGYELAKTEYSSQTIQEGELKEGEKTDKLIIKDRIADSMLQQVILRPTDYSIIATLNLNGDYLSDALAAQVGGLGIAPGANINYDTGHAVFEATHGSAPKHAGLDKANPGSLILSAVMMLEYMGWVEAAALIEKAFTKTIDSKKVTYDFHRQMENATLLKCSEFGQEIIKNI